MRSLLFVPADSERKLAKAPACGADVLVLDPALDRLLQRLVRAVVQRRILPGWRVFGDRLDQRCDVERHCVDQSSEALTVVE